MNTQRGLTRFVPFALAILIASLGTLGFIDADVALGRAAIAPDHLTCADVTVNHSSIPADIADRICEPFTAPPAAPSAPAFTVSSTAWRNAYDYAQELTEQTANAPFVARFESTAYWKAYSYAQELTEKAENARFVARLESMGR